MRRASSTGATTKPGTLQRHEALPRLPRRLIYPRVSPEVSMQRIQERGRDAEGGITLEYMEKLHQGYESFITEMAHYTRVLTLDWNEYPRSRPTGEEKSGREPGIPARLEADIKIVLDQRVFSQSIHSRSKPARL